MKFLLLNIAPGFEIFSKTKRDRTHSAFYPPLGLLYIGRSLEDEGHKIEIIDFLAEKNPIEKLRKSLSSVDAVGIGVFTDSYKESAYVSDLIKDFDSSLPVIIGGPHCVYLPKKSLTDITSADISVNGEGELIMKDIVNALQGTKKLSGVPGIHYREKNEIKTGKHYTAIADLDSLLFPARHLVDRYDYGKVNKLFFYNPKFTTILTSRGCPFQCKFCTRKTTSMKKYRLRSVENVVKEFQEIKEKYNPIMILDQNFFGDKKRVHKIMDGIIEMGSTADLLIHGARVDSVDRGLYKKMKKAGVKHIHFGIESGNQDVLDYYNKKITLDQIRKAVTLSKEMNFYVWGSFILGAPIETEKHIKQTMKFSCSLPLDIAIFYPLSYQRGSALWYKAVRDGNIIDDGSFKIVADSRKGLGNFTSDELAKFCIEAFRRFYFRPSYIIKQIYYSIRNKDFTTIHAGFNHI